MIVKSWADRFDTDRANLAEAQNEITGRLAGTLNVELGKDVGRRIDQERAVDPDARDLVMRGRAMGLRPFSVANRQEALRAFERALEIDSESIEAKIGIAGVLVANLQDGWSGNVQQDEARAEQLLLEAIERDENSAGGTSGSGSSACGRTAWLKRRSSWRRQSRSIEITGVRFFNSAPH